MCGRFVLNSSAAELAAEFDLVGLRDPRPRFNIAPSQDIAVVRLGADGLRELAFLRWGLIPSWAKDPSIGHRMINARGETAAEKPAFREALRQRRCIVPASGFYEWKGSPGSRRPHYVHADSGLFAMAGLWEQWRDPEDHLVESCTVLTTAANPLVATLHDRMPVLLARSDHGRWLRADAGDPDELTAMLQPAPEAGMAVREVDPRVNDVAVDDPRCIDPPAQLDLLS